MRARRFALAAVTLLALAAPTPAQQPPPVAPAVPPLAADVTPWPPVAAPCPPWSGRIQCDLLVGLPTGVRAQVRVNDDPAAVWFVEGFAGAEVILPTVGVGVRRRVVCWDDGRTSFAVNPGVDAYGVYALFGGVAAVVGDVDFVWGRRLDGGGWFDGGLKLGAGPAVGGDFWNNRHRVGVLPVASIVLGWHY